MKHSFTEASGQPDGIVLGRLGRHGDAPFGTPFTYTDAHDLPGNFKKPGRTLTLKKGRAIKVPWYRRWFHRRRPLAWVEIEGEFHPPQAYSLPDGGEGGEVRISPIEMFSATPVSDDRLIFVAEEYMAEHPEGEGLVD